MSSMTNVPTDSFFFQAEDGIRDGRVTGVQTCALPISGGPLLVIGGAGTGKTHLLVERFVWLADRGIPPEIGRASCRERGEIAAVPACLQKKSLGLKLLQRVTRARREQHDQRANGCLWA